MSDPMEKAQRLAELNNIRERNRLHIEMLSRKELNAQALHLIVDQHEYEAEISRLTKALEVADLRHSQIIEYIDKRRFEAYTGTGLRVNVIEIEPFLEAIQKLKEGN